MPNTTGRLLLPYIVQSQSQKEVTHNQALNLLDVLLQAVAQDEGLNTPPGGPTVGQCWVVGSYSMGHTECYCASARNTLANRADCRFQQ